MTDDTDASSQVIQLQIETFYCLWNFYEVFYCLWRFFMKVFVHETFFCFKDLYNSLAVLCKTDGLWPVNPCDVTQYETIDVYSPETPVSEQFLHG